MELLKITALAAALFCAACQTKLYGPDGKKRFSTGANLRAENLVIKPDGTLTAKLLILDHGTPTTAAGDAVDKVANTALMSGIAGRAILP